MPTTNHAPAIRTRGNVESCAGIAVCTLTGPTDNRIAVGADIKRLRNEAMMRGDVTAVYAYAALHKLWRAACLRDANSPITRAANIRAKLAQRAADERHYASLVAAAEACEASIIRNAAEWQPED